MLEQYVESLTDLIEALDGIEDRALNEKSYNEAYVLFSKIEEDNNYYYKAQSYLSIVVDDVLILIKNDVINIESGIEELSDDDKLIRYSQIEDVIIAYSSLYEALDLNNNEDYTNLLNTYKEKVNSLSQKRVIDSFFIVVNYSIMI